MALSSGRKDGDLYQYHAYARCDGCRRWWRQLVECRYHMMNAAGEGLPYETGYGERVRELTDWERSPEAGSSFAVWTNYDWEDPERVHCPDCRAARLAAAATLTLDLDGTGTTAADYTPDQAGHYDNPPPEPPAAPHTEEEALAALVPAGFVEQLDPRLGTAQVVEQLRLAGVTRPKGAAWNWNRLANLCTFAALDLKHGRADEPDPEPQPGEQLALA